VAIVLEASIDQSASLNTSLSASYRRDPRDSTFLTSKKAGVSTYRAYVEMRKKLTREKSEGEILHQKCQKTAHKDFAKKIAEGKFV